MANRARPRFISFGPSIPRVSVTTFTKIRMSREQWDAAWSIVGPSVERNMARDVPLWRIIAAAYLEGLNHGAGLAAKEAKL